MNDIILRLVDYEYIKNITIKNNKHIIIYIDSNISRIEFLYQLSKYLNIPYIKKIYPKSSVGGLKGLNYKIYVKYQKYSESNLRLRPKDYQILNKNYELTEYILKIKYENTKLSNNEIGAFLTNIVDHYTIDKELKIDMFTQSDFNITLPTKNIIIEYGEVITPIASISKNLISNGIINFPNSMNNSLIDCKISDNLISVKSAEGLTNTVKPSDICFLVGSNKYLSDKWDDTPIYQSLEILVNNTIKDGPFEYIKYMSQYYNEFNQFKYCKSWNDIYDLLIIDSSEYLKFKPKSEFLTRYLIECYISKQSKLNIDYTPIFLDAINSNIKYIMFNLKVSNVDAYTTCELLQENDIKDIGIYLRSKNDSNSRCSDKLGFEIRNINV